MLQSSAACSQTSRPSKVISCCFVLISMTPLQNLWTLKGALAGRIIRIDLPKRHHCLQPNRLINYLVREGVCAVFLKWLLSYLPRRRFRASTMNEYDGASVVTSSGVLQGSFLHPTHFRHLHGYRSSSRNSIILLRQLFMLMTSPSFQDFNSGRNVN